MQNQVNFGYAFIKIDRKPIKRWFTSKLFVCDFFKQDGSLKSWEGFNSTFNIGPENMFKWRQIRHAIPEKWKKIIREIYLILIFQTEI